MSRTFWPATLDDVLGEAVVPQCPGCPWSSVCPSAVQAGISLDLARGKYAVTDCLWHQRFVMLYRRETGEAPPEDFAPDDLAYRITERRGLRESA